MKKEFSTAWKASKQPRKQRKYTANAPIHIKRKFMNVNLSKELRKSQGKRSIILRKGDVVVVKTGKFKKRKGKVLRVNLKRLRVGVEGVQVAKKDGSKTNVSMKPSNLQIVELNLEERKKGSVIAKKPASEKKIEEKKIKDNSKSTKEKELVKKNAPKKTKSS